MANKVRTDEELAAIYLQPRQVHNAQINLAPYDPEWPRLYQREAQRIRATLGDRVLVLEHAGSTSIAGLSAKPQIDIVLGVADTADDAAYVPDMEAAGYVLRIRETDWHEHRLFKGPDTNINLHTFTVGCAEIDRMLSFRDHLRTDATDRELYENTKRELGRRTWQYVQDYADAKSAVVEEIIARTGVPTRACVLH